MQVIQSFLLSYLCREVATELELLQRNSHGVGTKEENEGHEGQVGNILTGGPHQCTTILHTLFFTQLTPVQVCQVKLQRQHKDGRGGGKWEERGERMGWEVEDGSGKSREEEKKQDQEWRRNRRHKKERKDKP